MSSESPEYYSSVLRCNVDDDGCPVCKFLNGTRDTETLLEVIRILDAKCADEEQLARKLAGAFGSRLKTDVDAANGPG